MEKKAFWQKPGFNLKFILALAISAVVLGVISRTVMLGWPNKTVFDEVYFPIFASKLLKGELVFDVHPPFGKMIIAAAIYIFGENTFGWRFMPMVFGILLLPIFVYLIRSWLGFLVEKTSKIDLQKYLGSLIILILVGLEGTLVLYSRVGLMDGVMLLFILLPIAISLKKTSKWQDLLIALLVGLAISIKWSSAFIIVLLFYVYWRKKQLSRLIYILPIAILVYYLIGVSGQIINGSSDPFITFNTWQDQAFSYHANLKDSHPWGSQWYSWPYLGRPLLMLYDTNPNGSISIMTAIGNPIVWYSATVAMIGSLIYLFYLWFVKLQSIKDHLLVLPVLGYFSAWLPWALVSRVCFIYHYLPAYAFALLNLSYWLIKLYQWRPKWAMVVLLIFLLSSIYFLPLATGIPISQKFLDMHIWVKSWL